jgi:DNA-binding winged helix-turn-helix (wHTH) protein
MTVSTPGPALRFGPGHRFQLYPVERRLLIDGAPAALGARAFDVLLALVEWRGTLLTKNQLLDTVWPDVVVEEHNLATQISTLRKLLGGDVIATIPGRGYRFAAVVEGQSESAPVHSAPVSEPAPAHPALVTNLPERLPPLLGRADDLSALGALVDAHALATIVGTGGMGKTRLAQTFLHGRRDAYRHGVCWVELAAVTHPAAMPATIAAALGVNPGQSDPLRGLCAAVAPLEMLVVLDNAEHIVEGTARVVQALLDAAPGVRLIVTSRAPLKLAAERVYRLEALAVPQGPLSAAQALDFGAVAPFAERAQAADSRFRLNDTNAPTVIELCRQLDGVPLAIELAAARAPMLGLRRLAQSMDDRLKVVLRRNVVWWGRGSTRGRAARLRFSCPSVCLASARSPGPRHGRFKGILVMQSAQHRFGEHECTRRQSMPGFWPWDSARLGRRARHSRTQRAVWTPPVVMSHTRFQDRTQMRLGDRDHPVQTLPADRSDHTLADRVGLGACERRSQHLQAQGANRIIQSLCEDPVPVVDQVLVLVLVADRLSQLLQSPVRTRVCRDVHMYEAARAVLDDDQYVQHPKGRGDGDEEIARENRRRMILQER